MGMTEKIYWEQHDRFTKENGELVEQNNQLRTRIAELENIIETDNVDQRSLERQQTKKIAELEAENRNLTWAVEQRNDILYKIENWCNAYPLEVFPEPDFKKVNKILKEHGISLDCISASNMRHVLKGIKSILDGE